MIDINRVLVVDDSAIARESVADILFDLDIEPIPLDGPLDTIDLLFKKFKESQANAAIFDHRLKASNYAGFLGAQAVYSFYENSIPSLLVTQWVSEGFDSIRKFRKNIPVLIKSDELEMSSISEGFEICIQEIHGNFTKRRKAWRTLIRIEEVDTSQNPRIAYAIIPAWNPKKGIKIHFDLFGDDLVHHIKEGTRLFAKVNLGAVDLDELYFDNFELALRQADIDAITVRN